MTRRGRTHTLRTFLGILFLITGGVEGFSPSVALAEDPEPRPPAAVGPGGGIRDIHARLQAPSSRTFTLSLQSGWNLIAFPLVVSPPEPAFLLSALIAQGVTTGTLYHWTGSAYEVVQRVEPGRAYWVKCTQDASVTVTGQPLADMTLAVSPGAAMIGNPLLEPLPLTQVFVSRGQQHLSVAEAVQAGWLGPQYATWDPSRVVPSDPKSGYQLQPITSDSVLTPGRGLWMKALQDVSVNLGGPPPDTTAPTGTIVISAEGGSASGGNAGAAFTTTPNVTLTLAATDDSGTVSQMQFSNDGTTYSAPEAFATTKAWTLTTGDGLKTVSVRFRDAAGNWSAAANDTITLDTSPPSTPPVIDDGQLTHDSTTLHATWTAATDPHSGITGYAYQVRETNSTGPVIVDWTSVGVVMEVTITGLTLKDGTTYVIGIRATNGAGLVSAAGFSDGITFRVNQAPTGTIVINGNDAYTTTPAVTLTLTATDDFGTVAQMQFSNDGTTYTTPEPFATTKTWTLAAGDGSKTVWAKFRDNTDLWSGAVTDTIILDTSPPSAPAVTDDGAKTTSQSQLHATWTAATDPHSGIAAYEYQIRQDSATGTVIRNWTSVGLATEVTAQGLSLTLGTTYYLGVRAKNGASLFSTPGFSDGITITTDATPPTGTIAINGGAAYTKTVSVALTLTATDNSGTVTQMQFSNDGTTYTAPEPYATTKAWTLTTGDGAKTVWVKFRDAADNWSTPVSASITLDTVVPVIRITTPTDGTFLGAP